MIKWEYKYIPCPTLLEASSSNIFGLQGWELIIIIKEDEGYTHVFKRQMTPTPVYFYTKD